MHELPAMVDLTDASSGGIVYAHVITLTTQIAKYEIDSKWWVLPGVPKSQRKLEPDHGWRWGDRLGKLTNDAWHQALAIQSAGGIVEGAILYWINTCSVVNPNLGTIYVESIASAPHNRKSVVEYPRFKGVGRALLLCAVIESHRYGFGGRITLESFNHAPTIAFYLAHGFEIVGHDGEGADRLPVLELSQGAAEIWLRKEGYLV